MFQSFRRWWARARAERLQTTRTEPPTLPVAVHSNLAVLGLFVVAHLSMALLICIPYTNYEVYDTRIRSRVGSMVYVAIVSVLTVPVSLTLGMHGETYFKVPGYNGLRVGLFIGFSCAVVSSSVVLASGPFPAIIAVPIGLYGCLMIPGVLFAFPSSIRWKSASLYEAIRIICFNQICVAGAAIFMGFAIAIGYATKIGRAAQSVSFLVFSALIFAIKSLYSIAYKMSIGPSGHNERVALLTCERMYFEGFAFCFFALTNWLRAPSLSTYYSIFAVDVVTFLLALWRMRRNAFAADISSHGDTSGDRSSDCASTQASYTTSNASDLASETFAETSDELDNGEGEGEEEDLEEEEELQAGDEENDIDLESKRVERTKACLPNACVNAAPADHAQWRFAARNVISIAPQGPSRDESEQGECSTADRHFDDDKDLYLHHVPRKMIGIGLEMVIRMAGAVSYIALAFSMRYVPYNASFNMYGAACRTSFFVSVSFAAIYLVFGATLFTLFHFRMRCVWPHLHLASLVFDFIHQHAIYMICNYHVTLMLSMSFLFAPAHVWTLMFPKGLERCIEL